MQQQIGTALFSHEAGLNPFQSKINLMLHTWKWTKALHTYMQTSAYY